MLSLSSALSLLFLTVMQLASACITLPASQVIDGRPYNLYQKQECVGGKVYEVKNVQDVDQCKEACVQFDCAAVNLFQLGEFEFMCEILSYVQVMRPAQGAACYKAGDVPAIQTGGYGGYGGGYGGYGAYPVAGGYGNYGKKK